MQVSREREEWREKWRCIEGVWRGRKLGNKREIGENEGMEDEREKIINREGRA